MWPFDGPRMTGRVESIHEERGRSVTYTSYERDISRAFSGHALLIGNGGHIRVEPEVRYVEALL